MNRKCPGRLIYIYDVMGNPTFRPINFRASRN